jgi:hypothetical protein
MHGHGAGGSGSALRVWWLASDAAGRLQMPLPLNFDLALYPSRLRRDRSAILECRCVPTGATGRRPTLVIPELSRLAGALTSAFRLPDGHM